MNKIISLLVGAIIAQLTIATTSWAGTINVSVDSQAGPWSQSTNPLFDYGVHDNSGPTVVTGLTPGETVTIGYVSGLTSAFSGAPPIVDGNGYAGGVFNSSGLGTSGTYFPGFFTVDPANTWLNELIGTFADSSGTIVGTPFTIGNGPLSVVNPAGATELLLGVNDDIYADNTGSLIVSVSANSINSVPEPSPFILMSIGLPVLLKYRKRI